MTPRFVEDVIWANDPGLVRLRQAARTILAVAIALALFHRFGSLISLFAAFATASFLQANSGANRRQRRAVMAVTGLATTVLVFAGGMCHGHRVAIELLLCGTAFLCFYARRFVPDRNLFTLYSFTLCLLAATFTGPWPQPLWIALAVLSGLPIAFVVYFYIWPPVYHVRFAIAVRTFSVLVAWCLDSAVAALAGRGAEPQFARRVAKVRAAMEACAAISAPLQGSNLARAANGVVRLMRRVVVCFELLQENLRAAGDQQRSDLRQAVTATAAALRHVRAEYLAPDLIPLQALHPGPLRDAVVAAFEKAPDHDRDERAAAALVEAGILAARLEELRSRIAAAMRDPAFLEDR